LGLVDQRFERGFDVFRPNPVKGNVERDGQQGIVRHFGFEEFETGYYQVL
jgi:hypothetical protein